MPVDMPANQQSQFCEEFLTSGGLSQIMQIFQVDHFPTDVEYEIRQACYSLALQLILYVTHHTLSLPIHTTHYAMLSLSYVTYIHIHQPL